MEQPNIAKGELPHYLCSECNEPVFIVEHIVYKPCGHTEATVLANIEAALRGTSAVS